MEQMIIVFVLSGVGAYLLIQLIRVIGQIVTWIFQALVRITGTVVVVISLVWLITQLI